MKQHRRKKINKNDEESGSGGIEFTGKTFKLKI